MSKRTIIVGDVHGCKAELKALLAKVAPTSGDTVVFAGDLFDRGPDSAGAVRVARQVGELPGVTVVLVEGNHEEKHRRFRDHLAAYRQTGKAVPIADSDGKKTAISDALEPADLAFLEGAVLFHRIPEHQMMVVHGGVTPEMTELPPDGTRAVDLRGKDRKVYEPMLRARFVDIETGKMVSMASTDTSVHLHWTEGYDGRFGRVVYGHEPYTGQEAPVEGYLGMSVGVDLGCVFGGRLCALVVHEDGTEEAVTVKARQAHSRRATSPAQMMLDIYA